MALMEREQNKLEKEIAAARLTISADGYPMSIGEITNLYRDGELIIRPEFQRFFRWNDVQKSRLIESILLGIPLPSIFVSQTETGQWELIDGLQRISTILQLQGVLNEQFGVKASKLVLTKTKFLSDLEGRVWEGEENERSLTAAQRLDIKRSKIDVKIIKRSSSPGVKFDLFQRINSYGAQLTAQEMRSALLVAASPEFFSWVEELANYPSFVESVDLGDRLIDERYDIELVLRFLVMHNWPSDNFRQASLRDFSVVLDNKCLEMAQSYPVGMKRLEEIFCRTFDIINDSSGERTFRKWDIQTEQFRGSFLNTAFEVFAFGLGYLIANDIPHRDDILDVVKKFWKGMADQLRYATGRSTEARFVQFVPIGREILRADNNIQR
jgi:hypothetical protein